MKGDFQLEPGLLRTYRLLSWVLVVISLFQMVSIYLHMGVVDMTINPLWIFPFGNFLILGLLYWPSARKKTGPYFVPILIVLATIEGIFRTYLTAMIRFDPSVSISILIEGVQNLTIPFEAYEISLIIASWQLIPLLFIPLIMVAWQYNFKSVIGYVIGSTLLELTIFLTFFDGNSVFLFVISILGVLATRTFTFLVVGFLVSRMMSAQREQQRELQQAHQQLLGYTMTLEQLATTRERNRLARELHDTIAHTLSALAVQLGAIKALWNKENSSAEEKLDDAIQTTRSGLNETRRALQALRASPLEDLGLCLAVRDLAKTAAARSGASITIEIPEIPVEISPEISQAFYRAAQESFENILRHSEAKHITLVMAYQSGELTLQVSDDGIGFDPAHLESDTYGLQGLKERAELINGRCVIDSQPGKGTTIIFSAGVKET